MDSELRKWKTIEFHVNDQANLPSLEALQGEIEQYLPKDFTIDRYIAPSHRFIDIQGEKPYNSYGNNCYIWCRVSQNDEESVNSYSIGFYYNIANDLHEKFGATVSNTWGIVLLILTIGSVVAAFFTGGATLLLTFLLGLYAEYDDRKEKKKFKKEENYLLDCREKIFQSLKELERELNMKHNDQKYSYGGASLNNDKLSALKKKLTSANGGKGFKIAEDGTIIRN